MFSFSRHRGWWSLVLAITPLLGLLTSAACREPVTPAAVPQDSIVLVLPTLALSVEVSPATIALGDTAMVRITLRNRSATPVAVDIGCLGGLSYRVETPAGEPVPWFSPSLCAATVTRERFASGEVRVVELGVPRFRPPWVPAAVPGQYQVRATFGELESAPVPFTITPGS